MKPVGYGPREWRPLKTEQPPLGKPVEFRNRAGHVQEGVRDSTDGHYAMQDNVYGSHEWRYLPRYIKRIKVVVSLNCGVPEAVEVDPQSDIQLDVVFIEDPKSSSEADTEFPVKSGMYKDEIVYCQLKSEPAGAVDITAVFKAARDRKNATH